MFALLCYSVGVLTEQLKHSITSLVVAFLSAGIVLDVTATICMIIGSRNTPLTLHGIIGYSALTAMLVDTLLVWKFWKGNGRKAGSPPRRLHLYTRLAYCWWVIAFLAGGMLAAMSARYGR